jgi:chromosome segregation ATPase
MKKKFFVLYALAGAFVVSPILTSCVDDDESASVTAVREAKAEQLKGLAALANAQAQAEATKASAEAALSAAQAEYQKALAEQALANAEQTAAYTEAKKQETEQAKAKYEAELNQIQAENDYQTAYYQYQLAQYQQYLTNLENNNITNLSYSYTNALSDIASLNSQIVDKKRALSQVDVDAAYAEAVYNESLIGWNKKIAQYTAEIEIYKNYEGTTPEEAQKELNEITASKLALANSKVEIGKSLVEITDAIKEAEDGLAESEYQEAIDALQESINEASYDEVNGWTYTTKYTYGYTDDWGNAINIISNADRDEETGLYTLKQSDILKVQKALKAKDAERVANAKANLETYQTNYKNDSTSLADKTKALSTEKDENTIATLKAEIEELNIKIAEDNENIADAQASLEEAGTSEAKFEELLAVIDAKSDAAKAYSELYAAKVEAEASEEELSETKDELDEQLSALSFAETLLNNELNGAVDVDAEIAALETKIAEVKKEIEAGAKGITYVEGTEYIWIWNYDDADVGQSWSNLDWSQADFEDYDGDGNYDYIQFAIPTITAVSTDFDADALKSSIQAQIDNLEAQLAIKQALADKYKAQLDALLGTAAE